MLHRTKRWKRNNQILKQNLNKRETITLINQKNKLVKSFIKERLNLPKEKGVIDFAINLIDFDDEYINAFFYAVGDTLVVEDQATARSLMGKYRMVTLNGEIFEKSGSITGGTVKKTGLKFSQNDDEELENFKSQLQKMHDRYKMLVGKKQDLETKLDKIRVQYSSSMTEFNKAQLELKVMHKDFDTNQASIDEKTEIIKTTEPKIEEISKKLDSMENELIEVSEKMTDYSSQIEEIEKLIQERQDARKQKNFARADEIRNQLLEQGIILEDTREGVKWKRA